MEKQWEKHLFNGGASAGDGAIVPVKFKRSGELRPLSILIVSRLKKKLPVIVPVGSILDEPLRKPASNRTLEKQWKRVSKKLREEIDECQKESSDFETGTHVEVRSRTSISEFYKSDTGIMASLSKCFTSEASSAGSLFSNLVSNRSVAVKSETLNNLFKKIEPLWTPEMQEFVVHQHIPEDGNLTMWVVTAIFTASQLIVAKTEEAALQAAVDPSLAFGDAAPGFLGKAQLKCHRKKDVCMKIEAHVGDSYFTYGFRASRLHYDKHGVLKLRNDEMGDIPPLVRGSDGSDSSVPSVEERIYHMGDFFAQAPRAHDPHDLECLEWDDEDDEQPELVFKEASGNQGT